MMMADKDDKKWGQKARVRVYSYWPVFLHLDFSIPFLEVTYFRLHEVFFRLHVLS